MINGANRFTVSESILFGEVQSVVDQYLSVIDPGVIGTGISVGKMNGEKLIEKNERKETCTNNFL